MLYKVFLFFYWMGILHQFVVKYLIV
ncbi:hypothetical protein O7W_00642, partial [Bartonella quintana JK 56]